MLLCMQFNRHTLQEVDYECNSPAGSCVAIERFQRFCSPPFEYLSEHFVFLISYELQTKTPMSFSISSCSLFYVSTHRHTHKASFPFQNQKAIIFHSVRLSPRQATVLRLSTMHEQSCMTFRHFVILSFRIYFDDLKSRTSLEHVDRRQLPTAFVLVRFGVLPIFFSAPSIALIG